MGLPRHKGASRIGGKKGRASIGTGKGVRPQTHRVKGFHVHARRLQTEGRRKLGRQGRGGYRGRERGERREEAIGMSGSSGEASTLSVRRKKGAKFKKTEMVGNIDWVYNIS